MWTEAPVMWMRGGTSRGGVFLRDDLPADPSERDRFLLRVMGSPDARQIDGLGGGDPLTSKVAVVSRSADGDADVEYLFLQVFVDEATVSDSQNCGNMLAAVGPFAVERGLVDATGHRTDVRVRMVNTGETATVQVETPAGRVRYTGDASIDGVPGTAAPVTVRFGDVAGSSCGALLPTGRPRTVIDGVACTLIDNGMPCVVLAADDVGVTGYEDRVALDGDVGLKRRLEAIRLLAGPLMNLGDVAGRSVPKLMLVAPARRGGCISVRSFIPHRVHASIGVLGAITVATACVTDGSVAAALATVPGGAVRNMSIEHPGGETTCVLEVDGAGAVTAASVLRTARKLLDGVVFA